MVPCHQTSHHSGRLERGFDGPGASVHAWCVSSPFAPAPLAPFAQLQPSGFYDARAGLAVQLPGCKGPRVVKAFLGTLPCDMPAGASVSASIGLNSMCLRCLWRPTTHVDVTSATAVDRIKVCPPFIVPYTFPTCACTIQYHVTPYTARDTHMATLTLPLPCLTLHVTQCPGFKDPQVRAALIAAPPWVGPVGAGRKRFKDAGFIPEVSSVLPCVFGENRWLSILMCSTPSSLLYVSTPPSMSSSFPSQD
jgi:hypothetical protein